MRIVGVDTDSKGSIAVLDDVAKTLTIYYIPSTTRKLANGKKRAILLRRQMTDYFREIAPVDAMFFEEQWSRPGQDAGSTFTFGCIYCSIIQSAEDASPEPINDHYVTGLVWKSAFRLDGDKSKSIRMADKVFPKCEKAWEKASKTAKSSGEFTSAAEAALIALYGHVTLLGLPINLNEYNSYDLILRTPERVTK